jgi:hypothetical protein
MMKNPRITFGIILVVMSIALMVVLVMTKRKPNVYDHSKWNPVFEFIRTADSVETVSTTYDAFEYKHPPIDILKYLEKFDPNGHHGIVRISPDDLLKLASMIRNMPDETLPTAACFCPHHFIIAKKGNEQIVVSLCYKCDGIGVTGALEVATGLRNDTQDNLSRSEFFYPDIFPYLKDNRCFINTGVYDVGLDSYGVRGPH